MEHQQGPLLVLAGAGSGKTRVITYRVARLMERGARPDSILAVSFTNKAAGEMCERLAQIVGPALAKEVWMSTFHSFGVRFISEESKILGHGSDRSRGGRFVIFDQGDSLGLVREILQRRAVADRRLDMAAILARISLWKNKSLAPEDVPESDYEYDAVARDVYPLYEESLRAMHAVDFDDLVVVPVRILRDHEDIREKWRGRFRHLMVDEFQDTNVAQLELVRQLTNSMGNICVVGDDDQSIYGWRGAEVENILRFDKLFTGTTVVKLEDNYRSRAQILDVANRAIFQSRHHRHEKTLRAARGDGDRVQICVAEDAEAEAKMVAKEIRRLYKEQVLYRDMAILYRSNLQARLIEEELRAADVPYRLFGGTQFFDKKEVKDAAAYLRAVVNPRDELSLRRIVNYPPRGIGATSVQRIAEHASGSNKTFARALADSAAIPDLPEAARQAAVELHHTLDNARKAFAAGRGLAAAARELFDSVGIERDLRASGATGKVADRRHENLQFLLKSIDRYEQSEHAQKPSLATFLQRITMRFDQEEEELGNRVTLSTLHASKGLEFGVVFLIGCVEGQLPHSRTTDPKATEAAPTDVEEERRLFYVGVTRARDRLYLSRPRRRAMRGRVVPLTPSRFLDDLPEASVEEFQDVGEVALEYDEVAAMAQEILSRLGG